MRIKWKDKSGGLKDFARWEGISRDKALGMMKRASGQDYEYNLHRLSSDEAVALPNFTLREDNPKFLYLGAK